MTKTGSVLSPFAKSLGSARRRLAKMLDKEYLERSVLKNLATLNLYAKCGFSQEEEMKRTLILAKNVR